MFPGHLFLTARLRVSFHTHKHFIYNIYSLSHALGTIRHKMRVARAPWYRRVEGVRYHPIETHISAASPPVAHVWQGHINVDKACKLCKRPHLPVLRPLWQITPFLFILCSTAESNGGPSGRIFRNSENYESIQPKRRTKGCHHVEVSEDAGE